MCKYIYMCVYASASCVKGYISRHCPGCFKKFLVSKVVWKTDRTVPAVAHIIGRLALKMKIRFRSACPTSQSASSAWFPAISYKFKCTIEEKVYTAAAISQQVFSQAEIPGIAIQAYLFLIFLSLTNREWKKVVHVCTKRRAQGAVSCLNGGDWIRSIWSPKIQDDRPVLIFFTPFMSFTKQVCEKKSNFFFFPLKTLILFTEILLFSSSNNLDFYNSLHWGNYCCSCCSAKVEAKCCCWSKVREILFLPYSWCLQVPGHFN